MKNLTKNKPIKGLDKGFLCYAVREQVSNARGCPIIINVGPGDFTDSGHFMTLTGYDSEGFMINDPNSRANSEKHWTYAQLQGQVRNLWAMYI